MRKKGEEGERHRQRQWERLERERGLGTDCGSVPTADCVHSTKFISANNLQLGALTGFTSQRRGNCTQAGRVKNAQLAVKHINPTSLDWERFYHLGRQTHA